MLGQSCLLTICTWPVALRYLSCRWMDMYITVGSSSKISCVPLPWCTSQSKMSTLSAPAACKPNSIPQTCEYIHKLHFREPHILKQIQRGADTGYHQRHHLHSLQGTTHNPWLLLPWRATRVHRSSQRIATQTEVNVSDTD